MTLQVSIIGLGYIGLPTAMLFAKNGLDVLGVDNAPNVLKTLRSGKSHIFEPGLQELLKENLSKNKFRVCEEITECENFIIAVPTPITANKVADLSYIKEVCVALAPKLKAGDLVVLESTSPVGTLQKVESWLCEMRPDLLFPHQDGESADVLLAYCPERILPGQALKELEQNDRIIGGASRASTKRAKQLYQKVVAGDLHEASSKAAELSKLVENSFRDLNLAFANQLDNICKGCGVDVWEVISLVNKHPRVEVLRPGPGVGGHCISVDPWFLHQLDPVNSELIALARNINDGRPTVVISEIQELLSKVGKDNPKLTCMGLSFKKNVDDLRNSPSLEIVEQLLRERNVEIAVVEPHLDRLPDNLAVHSNVSLVRMEQAIKWADVIVVLVDHDCFQIENKTILKGKYILDTRGIW